MRTISVEGYAKEPFDALLQVGGRLVALEGARGVALVVRHSGSVVVDCRWGDYSEDGLQPIFSISKLVTAIAVAHAAERAVVDLDSPIFSVWPGLSSPGVREITPRNVLGHRSGLASFDVELTWEELLAGGDEAAIESQEPYWKPNTAHGYHAFTFGTLLGGWFRRATGESIGSYFDRSIAVPHGLEVWLGAPEDVHHRVQRVDYPSEPQTTSERAAWAAHSAIPQSPTARLMQTRDVFNDPQFWSACMPSSSGVASAGGLAALLQLAIDGTILKPSTLEHMRATQSQGLDRCLGIPMHYGLGVQLPFPQLPMLGPGSFGHEAAGGSVAIGDPRSGLTMAWMTTQYPAMMGASVGALALTPSVRHCLEEIS